MAASETLLDEENAHVQELKRLFLSSNVDENQCLDRAGLGSLFEKLKLSEFSEEIAQRVLCGSETVDFYNFKERFVSFLPEIIDVSSGTVDPLVSHAVHTAQSLGFGNLPALTRYETRLLCENTEELEQLSVIDINALFERADADRSGRVTVQQFLSQYRMQKRLSAEVHFIADSYISTLNLFQALDPNNTGTIDSHDLMEVWNKAGLRIDEGLAVLKESGQPMSGNISSVYLSGFLETELSQAASEAPVSVKAAIVALHCCIDYLRCNVRDSESRADHLQKQLQLANQRRTLLIEELEHNQMSIEQGYEKRLRETEERYRARLIQMEDKFRIDKRDMQNEVEQVEEDLSRLRQQEVTAKNKVTLLERQVARLNEETREQSESLSQVEHLNRQLRNELSKAMQPRPVEDNTQLLMWKQKVDLLVAHNKRLREKIQELTLTQKKRNRGATEMDSLSAKWSSAFRTQVMIIRKRRLNRGDTLSEMDSEPESIFVRHRRRKLLKRGERKRRHEKIAGRLGAEDSDESSATNSRRREQTLTQKMEEQLSKLRDDHKKEVTIVRQNVNKTLQDALKDQEKQLSSQFDRERRQLESRLTNEKNQLERSFAEEKMKLMNRLQEDFDVELKRIASMVNRPESAATVEQYKRQIKALEISMEGQKSGYEKRLGELREKYKNSLRAQNSSYHIDKNTTNFISLIEKYRNAEAQPSTASESARSYLGVDKRPSPTHQPFQRSLSSMSPRCEKCEHTDSRLRELYHTIVGDQTSAESGIEDIGSSAGGTLTDDKIVLKREIRRLKGRLEAAKEKVTELRVVSAMGAGPPRYGKSIGGLGGSEGNGDWRRGSTRWSEVTATVERAESEKLILEARLAESQLLIKNLVEQYKKQLDETARLGGILKEVYAHPTTPENTLLPKQNE